MPDDYDYVSQRTLEHKPTNVLESTSHLIKGCLGAGIMGIPEAYMKCGLWTALGVTIMFGCFMTYCIHILVSSAQILYVRLKVPKLSYSDLAEKALELGPFPSLRKHSSKFRYGVDIIICIDLFGSCAVYEIIIGKTIQQLIDNSETEGPLHMLRLYILILAIPVLLLCMIRSLKYLSPFSAAGDIVLVMCVASTVRYADSRAPPLSEMPAWKNFIGFFEFCGVVVYSMEGFGICLPIENNMKEPKKFPIVLCFGMAVVVFFVAMTGFYGYWGYGETVISPVTLNFSRELFPTILKALVAVMIFITFGLNFWAPFNLVWHYLNKRYPENKHYIWERVYRAIFVILITVAAIAFPNMGPVMGLMGSFCISLMGFVYPAMIETLVKWESPGMGPGKWRLWKNLFIIITGLVLMTSGTYSSGKALIEGM
ncbi:proton-coupled amino acid transporter-like protein pathetic [Anticarsia gemmatalis]|uniref:proton-coupled amino acid transporter-like protein pathetic n=1 Tax=Anticarsia gemmatalis TaxID=129554 RepID=UPI003F75C186